MWQRQLRMIQETSETAGLMLLTWGGIIFVAYPWQ